MDSSTMTTTVELKSLVNVSVVQVFRDNATAEEVPYGGLVSSETYQLVEMMLEIVLSMLLASTGFMGNAMALLTFAKIGYQDTINISLSFICAWDLFRCVLGLVTKLYVPFRLVLPVFAVHWHMYGMISFGQMAVISGYVSTVLSAFVAVERCLCVSLPFTVKFLLTPRVVFVNNLLISLVVACSRFTIYITRTIGFVFNAKLNATVPHVVKSPVLYDHPELGAYLNIMSSAWLVLSFVVTCISTAVIWFHLRRAAAFKKEMSTGLQKDTSFNGGSKQRTSGRDRQVMRMLFVVIVLNLFTSLPRVVQVTCSQIFPEFHFNGLETNFFNVVRGTATTIEFVNYNASIFVFYLMSSQFRTMFRRIFCQADKVKSTSSQGLATQSTRVEGQR